MNGKWMHNAIEDGRERLDKKFDAGLLTSPELIERNMYMNSIERAYAEAIRIPEPRVFLSYAQRCQEYGKKAYNVVSNSKSLARNLGSKFHVETGFRINGEAEVRDQVLRYLKSCCLFLGVMTAELRLDVEHKADGIAAPASWVVIEAGMAEALGIPVVLLVERGVHSHYWLMPFKIWRHIEFEKENFDFKLRDAVERLREQYRNLSAPH